jgi:hypothetical protein
MLTTNKGVKAMLHHVDKIDSSMQNIITACFPAYKGKTVKISVDIPSMLRSYWDGGSRTYYAFYSLENGVTFEVESNHPMFEAGKPGKLDKLPERVLLVAHSIFCGKDMGITIYANASDLAPMLPKNEAELTFDEKVVLTFTRCFKSSYAGIPNYRAHEASRVHGMTLKTWEITKQALIEKGLLNKAGAITANGKNAIDGNEVKRF